MPLVKSLELHGKPLGGGKLPLVCTPLVGRTRAQILSELAEIVVKRPDLLEWRVDFFDGSGDSQAVLEVAASIKTAAAGVPVLFTCRSEREGGERIALTEAEVLALYTGVCRSRSVDMVDFEMGNAPAHVCELRQLTRENDIQLILSFHDFQATPNLQVLKQRFLQAQQLGADVAKVAVMPNDAEDVLTLLAATLQSSQELEIPLISMAMGELGLLTRVFGWAFGSTMTFAAGATPSAPGQLPIQDLQSVLAMVAPALPSFTKTSTEPAPPCTACCVLPR